MVRLVDSMFSGDGIQICLLVSSKHITKQTELTYRTFSGINGYPTINLLRKLNSKAS